MTQHRKPFATFDDHTATVASAPQTRAPLAVLLRVVGAPASPPERRFERGVCRIGSAPSSDICISERSVSRNHLELELAPEGVSVRDLGSRNGTFYLGQRVQAIVLGVGGRLRIGAAADLHIEADSSALMGAQPYTGDDYHGVVGVSASMRALFAVLTRLEGSLINVLLEGESGTGKEVIARVLHDASRVGGGPFVAVNCGAIPRDLVASELFGHRRGAFTGAIEARRGAFEAAHGGTLFLDEIGELPVEVQPMLLRALETGEIRAVGDDHSRTVKVRVVAATHRDLDERVRDGSFREDLFYRLAVVRLRVPPLRERPEDIVPLAQRFAAAEGLHALPKNILDELLSRPFAGNARELRNLIQAYAALGTLPAAGARAQDVRRLALERSVDLSRPFLEQRDALVDAFTRAYLDALLAHTGGNQTAAAALAGLDRTYLGRLLAKVSKAPKP